MRVLADSHALVWYFGDDPELSARAGIALGEAEATEGIFVSAVGLIDLWYASHKRGSNKVGKREYEQIRSIMEDEDSNYHVLAFGHDTVPHAESFAKDRLPDPFDRMILATAIEHGLPLVTADKRITELELVDVIW